MTKEDEFFALANAPLSAPDRLKGLMNAATKCHIPAGSMAVS